MAQIRCTTAGRFGPLFTDLPPRSECLETGNQYTGIRAPI